MQSFNKTKRLKQKVVNYFEKKKKYLYHKKGPTHAYIFKLMVKK